MRIMYIHNDYGAKTGEEHAAEAIVDLLVEHGHTVDWYRRSSEELLSRRWGNVKAFFTGIWNPATAKAVARALDRFQPDVVQIQNLYPLISPSVLRPIHQRCIPTVMRCPNYRLFCPNGRHLSGGAICERCLGRGRELWCILKNCEESILKSTGYGLRCAFARCTRAIVDYVDVFIVQSLFQKNKFVARGIPADRVEIVPGVVSHRQVPVSHDVGRFVSFIGRVSPEKGVEDVLAAARALPEIPFVVAGDDQRYPHYRRGAPNNVRFLGFLRGNELDRVYSESRIVVVPSRWYEGFPNVIVQAMAFGRPVVASNIGALASIVRNGESGVLCEPMDARDLGEKIRSLYYDPERCRRLGETGRREAMCAYSRESVYTRLMEVYEHARGSCAKA